MWLNDIFSVKENLLKLGAVIISGILAHLLSKKIAKQLPDTRSIFLGTQNKFLSTFAPAIRKLLFPVCWLALLGILGVVLSFLPQTFPIIRTAGFLIAAWAVIRLGSYFIINPFVRKSVATIVWVITALSILNLLEPTVHYLQKASLKIGDFEINAFEIISSTLAIGFFLWIAIIIIRIFENRLSASKSIDASIKVLLIKLFKYFIITLAILGALSAVGFDLTTLAVFGGAIGVGIGFGLQKIFSNLLSGFILLVDKSIKPGDIIEVNGTYGKVDKLAS